jgi:ferrochelatase
MRRDGVSKIKAICLAPQNSRTSVGLYRRDTLAAAAGMEVEFIAGWADHPLLAAAFAERLRPIWIRACAEAGERVPVLFTAHSVPCRTVMTGPDGSPPDRYPTEAKRTAALVAESLADADFGEKDWHFAFQSQGVSGGPWIGPTVEETLKAIRSEGHTGVVIQPIGFLCDHVEILYDIDIAFKATAESLGLRLWRAESLNDSGLLVRALSEIASGVLSTAAKETTVSSAV